MIGAAIRMAALSVVKQTVLCHVERSRDISRS
jgi:hypothetical protein